MKRIFSIAALAAVLALLAGTALAHTITKDDTSGVIEIVTVDQTNNIDFAVDSIISEPNGLRVNSIQITGVVGSGSAAIRTGSAAGPRAILSSVDISKDALEYKGKRMKLYVKASEVPIGTIFIVDYFPDSWINRNFWITP